jgi:hypothetical protein
MLLDEIGTYLQAQGVGTVGTDLFQGLMPDDVDAVVSIYETPGASPIYVHDDVTGIKLEQPRLAVWARGVREDYAAPRQKAEDVVTALAAVRNQTLSGTRYLRVRVTQPPFLLRRDDNDRVVIAANFEAVKVPS